MNSSNHIKKAPDAEFLLNNIDGSDADKCLVTMKHIAKLIEDVSYAGGALPVYSPPTYLLGFNLILYRVRLLS